MKVRTAALTIALSALTVTHPALAADWGNAGSYDGGYAHEGIKDFQGGEAVPVPAPVPIPEYEPSWYFRLDAGLGVVNDPGLSGYFDLDSTYGHPDGPSTRYDLPTSWFNSDFDTFLTLGGGVGYYFGNGWRIDAQVEKRSKDDYGFSGSDDWLTYADDGLGNWDVVDVNTPNGEGDSRTRITTRERGKLDGTVWTANLYRDFQTFRGFTPYIGAGIGFVWNEIRRSNSTTLEQCVADDATGNCTAPYTPHPSAPGTLTSSDKAEKVSLAAAAMAGFSYQISDITSIDMGYRYLFLQGTDAVLDVGGRQTRVEIDNQHVHQFRTGLRFDVN